MGTSFPTRIRGTFCVDDYTNAVSSNDFSVYSIQCYLITYPLLRIPRGIILNESNKSSKSNEPNELPKSEKFSVFEVIIVQFTTKFLHEEALKGLGHCFEDYRCIVELTSLGQISR